MRRKVNHPPIFFFYTSTHYLLLKGVGCRTYFLSFSLEAALPAGPAAEFAGAGVGTPRQPSAVLTHLS